MLVVNTRGVNLIDMIDDMRLNVHPAVYHCMSGSKFLNATLQLYTCQ